MSAVMVYEQLSNRGESPCGKPVIGRVYTNSLRPAVMLGRGATSRVATEASSGSTSYFFASVRNTCFSCLTLSGYLAATSSHCVQSLVRSYSSQVTLFNGSGLTAPMTSHGGRMTFVLSIQPSL